MGQVNKPLRILLGSGGIATDRRRALYRDLVAKHFSGCETVLFAPFASHDHDDYISRMQDFLGPSGPRLVGIQEMDHSGGWPKASGIYVGGGNSFLLVHELHKRDLVQRIRDSVLDGMPYLGVSAGANVASPTMMTTNDMPIALPSSFDSMGIVPFQINPHYHPGKIVFRDGDSLVDHFGETRAQRIREFHRVSETPVLGLWEGSYVSWDGSIGILIGKATAFRKGEEPIEIPDGAQFDGKLETCK